MGGRGGFLPAERMPAGEASCAFPCQVFCLGSFLIYLPNWLSPGARALPSPPKTHTIRHNLQPPLQRGGGRQIHLYKRFLFYYS